MPTLRAADRLGGLIMKKIIKEYILDSLAYLSAGIWIGAGVAVGFFGITALLIR